MKENNKRTTAAPLKLPLFDVSLAFLLQVLRADLRSETGGYCSANPASEAKYIASSSLPLFTSWSIISEQESQLKSIIQRQQT